MLPRHARHSFTLTCHVFSLCCTSNDNSMLLVHLTQSNQDTCEGHVWTGTLSKSGHLPECTQCFVVLIAVQQGRPLCMNICATANQQKYNLDKGTEVEQGRHSGALCVLLLLVEWLVGIIGVTSDHLFYSSAISVTRNLTHIQVVIQNSRRRRGNKRLSTQNFKTECVSITHIFCCQVYTQQKTCYVSNSNSICALNSSLPMNICQMGSIPLTIQNSKDPKPFLNSPNHPIRNSRDRKCPEVSSKLQSISRLNFRIASWVRE